MREADPQPRMSTVRISLYLTLLAVSVALAVLTKHRRLLNDQNSSGLIISIMTTLLIISAVELIPELASIIGEFSEVGKFRQFFGAAAIKDDVRFVTAYRCLRPGIGSDPWITHHQIAEIDDAKPVPEGVNAWMPAQDIRAAVDLSNLFFKFTSRRVRFIHDKDIDDDFEYCAVSIGLGFNGFTHRLASWCDNRLFKIEFGNSIKSTFTRKTDYFSLGDGKTPEPPLGKDDCLIARIVPVTLRGKPRRVCFVCAGRTAPGTAVAGYFLANNWERIMRLYQTHGKKLERDSLAVVIRHITDSAGNLEFLREADLVKEEGQVVCCWGLAEGVD